jgi:hypothetical protein
MTPTSANPAEQLAVLFPEPKVLRIGDRDVTVREMPMRKIAKFATLLAPVLARYPVAFDARAFFVASSEAIVEGLAHAVDQPPEWVGELPRKEFEQLVTAVREMNQDFFAVGVGPLVSDVLETMLTKVWVKREDLPIGQTSSPPSSSTATETPAATH